MKRFLTDCVLLYRCRTKGRDTQTSRSATEAFCATLQRLVDDFEARGGDLYEDDFSQHLRYFSRHWLLKRIHPYIFDLYNLPYFDYLYLQLAVRMFDHKQTMPALETKHDDPHCLQEIVDNPKSKVVLSLHNGFSHTTRILSSTSCGLTTIIGATRDEADIFLKANHVTNFKNVRVVSVDRDTLINLDTSVAKGDAILCAPDCIDPRSGKCDYVSNSMFRFAVSKGLPIYFFDYAVTDRFQLRVYSERAAPGQDAEQTMRQFIRFCARSSGRQVAPLFRAR